MAESLAFAISAGLAGPIGKVGAIRVQDIARQIWFTWDLATRTWNTPPSCTPGSNLYVSFWAINQGGDGNLRLRIIDDAGNVLADKTVWCAYWNGDINVGVGVETGTKTMPSRPYGITIEVSP